MKLEKVKLIKGQYLEVVYLDGTATVSKSYPSTEAPKYLTKAFAALNAHLCKLTCQFDNRGNLDTASVVCRGYYFKGEGEKEELILTGLRSLPNGRTLIIPASPRVNLESDAGYSDKPALIKALEECRKSIVQFMENNPGVDEIQGTLELKEGGTKTHILKATTGKNNAEEEEPESDELTEQEKMDRAMPITQEQLQVANAKKNKAKPKGK